MPKLSTDEQIAIRAFLKSRDPILCAPGSRAMRSIDIFNSNVANELRDNFNSSRGAFISKSRHKPFLYYARSANQQRVIASTQRGIKIALAKANSVICLPA